MIVLGITGSIGMGKTTTAQLVQRCFRMPVWDADRAVHHLYRTDRALLRELKVFFPDCVGTTEVDREKLAALVFEDPEALAYLELLVYPHLLKCCQRFIHNCTRLALPLCAIDVPLLFEKGWDQYCDYTLTVEAPHFIQQHRLRNKTQAEAIRSHQMSEFEKSHRADFTVFTGLSKHYIYQQIKEFLSKLEFKA